METLKDLTAELISWLDSECPAVAPPLEPYDNSDLSHNFCELLRIRLDEINRLRSQVEQESGQILSPEKLLESVMFENNFTYVSFPSFVENESSVDVFDIACKAIESCRPQFNKVSDEESKGYLCSVCHKNPVDAENGYDTCPDCVSKI